MVEDAHISRNDFIFQDCTSWNINAISMIGDNNDGTLIGLEFNEQPKFRTQKWLAKSYPKRNSTSECNITGHS